MYTIYRKATFERPLSTTIYTVTIRKWDNDASPYEVVDEMEDYENDYNPGYYHVHECNDFNSAFELFMSFVDSATACLY